MRPRRRTRSSYVNAQGTRHHVSDSSDPSAFIQICVKVVNARLHGNPARRTRLMLLLDLQSHRHAAGGGRRRCEIVIGDGSPDKSHPVRSRWQWRRRAVDVGRLMAVAIRRYPGLCFVRQSFRSQRWCRRVVLAAQRAGCISLSTTNIGRKGPYRHRGAGETAHGAAVCIPTGSAGRWCSAGSAARHW